MTEAYPLPVPIGALAQHLAIIGKTGSGKTYLAKLIVEWLLSEGRRVVVIDPTGAWWGLRSSADGKSPGFPVVVFGGDHADVQINDKSGAALAELIASTEISCVIDLSDFMVGESHRFMAQFAEVIFKQNNRPLHLIIDEADEFAPQRPMPDSKVMLNRIDRIVRRGRKKGFRVTMITQRPAVINKDVLTQASAIIAMHLIGPQDRDAVMAWIKDQADPEVGKGVIASLPKLKTGEGWVWSPADDVLERKKFPSISTFDSSQAPDDNETESSIAFADIDLAEIRNSFAVAEEEATANNPKVLRGRIAELERKLSAGTDRSEIDAARRDGIIKGRTFLAADINSYLAVIDDNLESIRAAIQQTAQIPVTPALPQSPPAIPRPPIQPPAPKVAQNGLDNSIQPRHQRVLDAVAWFNALGIEHPSKKQVAFAAGVSPKSGAFNNNLGALRSSGLVDYPVPGHVVLTEDGASKAARPATPGTSAELHNRVCQRLRPGLASILKAAIAEYPNAVTKAHIAEIVGKSSTSGAFTNSLGSLRSLGVINYPTPGHIRAEDILFV